MAAAEKLVNSKREKVTVSRRHSDFEHRIFQSTVIVKDGRPKLEQFRIPVGVEVELPVEIIKCVKERGIAKMKDGNMIIVPEFLVESV